jgi:hypothetical protein
VRPPDNQPELRLMRQRLLWRKDLPERGVCLSTGTERVRGRVPRPHHRRGSLRPLRQGLRAGGQLRGRAVRLSERPRTVQRTVCIQLYGRTGPKRYHLRVRVPYRHDALSRQQLLRPELSPGPNPKRNDLPVREHRVPHGYRAVRRPMRLHQLLLGKGLQRRHLPV